MNSKEIKITIRRCDSTLPGTYRLEKMENKLVVKSSTGQKYQVGDFLDIQAANTLIGAPNYHVTVLPPERL